jgi:hypothetical protein
LAGLGLVELSVIAAGGLFAAIIGFFLFYGGPPGGDWR